MGSKVTSLLQKAGQSMFTAAQTLKSVTELYAQQVPKAMATTPFSLETDQLIDSWKAAARLAQEVAALDARMVELFEQAQHADAAAAVKTPLQLAAPAAAVAEKAVTDVVPKAPKSGRATQRKLKIKKVAKKAVKAARTPGKLAPNTQKLLTQLEKHLNTETFIALKHSELAKASGLPQGSVGASLKKLLESNHIVQGARGEFKLVAPAAAA